MVGFTPQHYVVPHVPMYHYPIPKIVPVQTVHEDSGKFTQLLDRLESKFKVAKDVGYGAVNQHNKASFRSFVSNELQKMVHDGSISNQFYFQVSTDPDFTNDVNSRFA